ncbi:MAG: hypothetical protein NG712_01455 [Omnitrophica bacterium]|nr:hypothetical protein [Candidatus Omnitrophota bacterium]
MEIKNKKQVTIRAKKIISSSYILEELLKEIKGIKRGKVKLVDIRRRTRIARKFAKDAQIILSFVKISHSKINPEILENLKKVKDNAEAVLRENPIMLAKSPVDVIRFTDLPEKYAINHLGQSERRHGFGLHKFPRTERDLSVCIAYMPTKYIQMYHNHTTTENTFILDDAVYGIFKKNGKKIKIKVPSISMIHFSTYCVHTMYNSGKKMSRNITVKAPHSLLDWKPFYLDESKSEGRIELITEANRIISNNSIQLKIFRVRRYLVDYDIEIMTIKPKMYYAESASSDRYFFVVEGKLNVTGGSVAKKASKDDIIVIDKGTSYTLRTQAGCILYSVKRKRAK